PALGDKVGRGLHQSAGEIDEDRGRILEGLLCGNQKWGNSLEELNRGAARPPVRPSASPCRIAEVRKPESRVPDVGQLMLVAEDRDPDVGEKRGAIDLVPRVLDLQLFHARLDRAK